MKDTDDLSLQSSALNVERSAAAAAADSPWPGLTSYSEDQAGLFHGRDAEIRELSRRAERNALTVLFGQSGLGKSSLLQAGVFPRLRASGYWPIYVRLDHAPGAPAPTEQIKAIVQADTARAGAWTRPGSAKPGETLWEFFHHRDDRLLSAAGRVLVPVLVFDQFEELFTLGAGGGAERARAVAFIGELAELVENRPSEQLVARLEESSAEMEVFDFSRTDYRVVITLREDFLPHLESLKTIMPALMENRLRLARMTGTQALEAVVKPGGALVTAEVAQAIVEFVAGARGGSAERLAELDVEPPLLSVICRELNERRKALGQAQITADLVSGNRREILTDFYERSVADLPESMRTFVEDKLLTKSGFRDNLALETALEEPGVTRPLVDTLVSRRLLRLEDRLGVQRVELTHDVLAEVIRASRDERQQRGALARLQAQERLTRRRMWLARGIAAGLLVVAGVAIWATAWAVRRQQLEAQRWSRSDLYMANRFLAEGKVHEGLSYLVHAARVDPNNPVVAPRLLSVLTSRSFATPHGDPLQLRPVQELGANTVRFSRDSRQVGVNSDGRVFQVVDFARGVVEREIQLPEATPQAFLFGDTAFAYTFGKQAALHDLSTGQVRTRFVVPETWNGGSSSLDRRWVYFRTSHAVYVYDGQSGALRAKLPHDREIYSAAISLTGDQLFTVEKDGLAQLWTWGNGRYLARPIPPSGGGPVYWGTFAPDGRRVAVGQPGGIRLHDTATGESLGPVLLPEPTSSLGGSAQFTSDGARLVARANSDRFVCVWEVATGRLACPPLVHSRNVTEFSVSEDDQRIVTYASDRYQRIWDLATGQLLLEPIRRFEGEATEVAIDGRRMVRRRKNGELYRYWLDATPARPLAWRRTDPVLAASWLPDRPATVRRVTPNGVFDLDAATGEKLEGGAGFPEEISRAILSQDGQAMWVQTAAGVPQAWRRAGHAWEVVALPDFPTASSPRVKLDRAGDRAMVIGAPAENQMQVWSLRSGKPLSPVLSYKGRLFSGPENGHFSPDGSLVSAGSHEGEAKVWEVATGRLVLELQPLSRTIRSVEWSPDGKRLATVEMAGRGARLWDSGTGLPVSPPLRHLGQAVTTTPGGFSADGRWMLDFSQSLGTVRIWDVRQGVAVGGQIEHANRLRRPAFNPEGTQIATPCGDGALRLWDVGSGQLVAEPMRHGGAVLSARYSPDGRFVLTECEDGFDRIWAVPFHATGRAPEWLLRLATLHAGTVVGDDGNLTELNLDAARLGPLRKEVQALPESAPFARWGKWLFAERDRRPLAPGFAITSADAEARGLVAAGVVTAEEEDPVPAADGVR